MSAVPRSAVICRVYATTACENAPRGKRRATVPCCHPACAGGNGGGAAAAASGGGVLAGQPGERPVASSKAATVGQVFERLAVSPDASCPTKRTSTYDQPQRILNLSSSCNSCSGKPSAPTRDHRRRQASIAAQVILASEVRAQT